MTASNPIADYEITKPRAKERKTPTAEQLRLILREPTWLSATPGPSGRPLPTTASSVNTPLMGQLSGEPESGSLVSGVVQQGTGT
jgi:hypothetical protein